MKTLNLVAILIGMAASSAALADTQLICRGGPMTVKVLKDKIYGAFSDKNAVYTEIKFRKAQVPGTKAMQLAPGECTVGDRVIANNEPNYFWYRREGSMKSFTWGAQSHAISQYSMSIKPLVLLELMRDAGNQNRFLHLRTKSQGFRVVEATVSARQTGSTVLRRTVLAPIEGQRVRTRPTRSRTPRPRLPRNGGTIGR